MPSRRYCVTLPGLPAPDAQGDDDEQIQQVAGERFTRLTERMGGPWHQLKYADIGAAYVKDGLVHQVLLDAPPSGSRTGVWWLTLSVGPPGGHLVAGTFLGVLVAGVVGVGYLTHELWRLPAWTMIAGCGLSGFVAFIVSQAVSRFPVRGRSAPALNELAQKLSASLGTDFGVVESRMR